MAVKITLLNMYYANMHVHKETKGQKIGSLLDILFRRRKSSGHKMLQYKVKSERQSFVLQQFF